MKNVELLDRIGEVNEDYVLSAGDNVAKPRFRWKTLAACAACGLLALGVSYPAYMAAHPPLHSYTVLEDGGMATLGDMKAPEGGRMDAPGQDAPGDAGGGRPIGDDPGWEYAAGANTLPGGDDGSGDKGEPGLDGAEYNAPGQDAPVDEAAAGQYSKLLQGLGGVDGMEPESYPDWFAGAWIDTSCYYDSPAVLTVAIVDGFRTDALEAQIRGWCGSGVVFWDAKYSYACLDGLMEQTVALLDGAGLNCGIGVYVMDNCVGVDIYSDGADVPNAVLAELARLDPAGDAIRVRLFTGKIDTLTDEIMKCPPELAAPDGGMPAPGGKTEPAPGTVEEGGAEETAQPAVYGLPQVKAGPTPVPAGGLPGYDLLYGGDE